MITFDDGKANVFSLAMSQTIEKLLDEVSEDKGALLLIGRPGMFSAGFDLKVMSSGDGEAVQEMVKGGFKLLRRIYSFPRPVVAACSGHGIALGAFVTASISSLSNSPKLLVLSSVISMVSGAK